MYRTVTALRLALAAGALLALAHSGAAQPFPGAKARTAPVIVVLVPYLGDENVQKELKLDATQTKKLVAVRQKLWDEVWTTAQKDVDFEARSKATATAIKEVLTADQIKRANQLATQIVWNGPRGGFGGGPGFPRPVFTLPVPDARRAAAFALTQYPELADALKLDDTQKKLTTGQGLGGPGGRFGPVVYLTPDQSATAKELLGAAYKGTLQLQFDPRNAFGGGGFGGPFGNGPAALQYTNAPDVQKELKLTEAQLRDLVDLRLKQNQPGMDIFGLSPADRKKVLDERLADTEKALNAILTADQRTRLRQIERQQQSRSGPQFGFSPTGDLAKDLAITEAQTKQYAALTAAHAETVAKAVLSEEPFEKVRAAVEAIDKDHRKAVEEVLTADQRAKQKELLGETFTGNVFAGLNLGFNANQRKFSFGRYSGQLSVLTYFKGVQEELKLKDDQVKKLTDLMAESNTKFPFQQMIQALQDEKTGNTFFADQSAFIEKALDDVLTKEQRGRFRELQLQSLEAPPQGPGGVVGFGPPSTAASYPGVAEAIKLTADQKKKLLDGANPAEVLTAEQKKAIAGMLGKPANLEVVFAQPSFPNFPGGVPPRAISPEHQLLLNTLVWDALKLTRDQTTKIATAANEYLIVTSPRRGPGGGPGGFPGGAPVDPKELDAAIDAFGKAATDALSAEQKKRLAQLTVQQAVVAGLEGALLANPPSDLAKALAPTDEQKKNLTAARNELGKLTNLLNRTNISGEKDTSVRLQLRDRLDARVQKELTDDQKAKLKELAGAPFDGFPKQPLFGGGFGPGGGGGFGGPFGP